MTKCTVCRHKERTKVEALVASGLTMSSVAKRFGLNKASLSRHMNGTPTQAPHVTPQEMSVYLAGTADVTKLRQLAAKENGTILEDLQLLKSMCFKQIMDAANVKDANRFAALAARFLDILQALGQRTGEISRLNPAITVNNTTNVSITASPQFVRLQRGLMRLVMDHPELRADIAAMLRDCEGEEARGELLTLEASHAA